MSLTLLFRTLSYYSPPLNTNSSTTPTTITLKQNQHPTAIQIYIIPQNLHISSGRKLYLLFGASGASLQHTLRMGPSKAHLPNSNGSSPSDTSMIDVNNASNGRNPKDNEEDSAMVSLLQYVFLRDFPWRLQQVLLANQDYARIFKRLQTIP